MQASRTMPKVALTFARTHDYELIRRALLHESQFRMASEDATPAPGAFRVNRDERIVYLRADSEGKFLGVFTLLPANAVCYEIHAALLPVAWGYATRPALRGALEWAFRETPARRIVCAIPAYNKLAIKLARDCGLRAYGRNFRAFERWGALHDIVLLGVSAT